MCWIAKNMPIMKRTGSDGRQCCQNATGQLLVEPGPGSCPPRRQARAKLSCFDDLIGGALREKFVMPRLLMLFRSHLNPPNGRPSLNHKWTWKRNPKAQSGRPDPAFSTNARFKSGKNARQINGKSYCGTT